MAQVLTTKQVRQRDVYKKKEKEKKKRKKCTLGNARAPALKLSSLSRPERVPSLETTTIIKEITCLDEIFEMLGGGRW